MRKGFIMAKKVLILHGYGGSDYPHWQAWLACELIKINYEVCFPHFPNKDNPNLEQWLEFLDKQMKNFDPDIVVCHSLANILWFHYVQKYQPKQLQKLMLVAPVRKTCDIKEIKTFFPYPVPNNLCSQEVIMASSDNDPYINVEEAIQLQQELNIGMKIMENAGHLNADSGFGELTCALEWVTSEVER